MNVLRRIAMAISGTVVVALVLTLAVPRAAHAVLSAVVTVTNAPTNPVPTQSVDNPALAPSFSAQGTCSVSGSDFNCQNDNFFTIPQGMTAVVKDVSGHCRIPTYVENAPIYIYASGGNYTNDGNTFTGFSVELTPILVGHYGDLNFYDFGREAALYATSTTAAQASFQIHARIDGGDCTVGLSGYYVKNGQ